MKITRITCKKCEGTDVIHFPRPNDPRGISPAVECDKFEKAEDMEVEEKKESRIA